MKRGLIGVTFAVPLATGLVAFLRRRGITSAVDAMSTSVWVR